MRGLIIGTGPSLRGQIDLIHRFDGLVFICNNCFVDFPEADCWLACDPTWHATNGQVTGDFDKYHWSPEICKKYGYTYIEGVWMVDGVAYPRDQYTTPPGPCGGLWLKDKTRISLNHCSGAQLLNLAVSVYECDPVLLVGHDFRYEPGKPRHYFTGLSDVDGEYAPELRKTSEFRKPHDPDDLMSVYQRIAETPGLQTKIINCTPDSALPWFTMGRLEDYVSS